MFDERSRATMRMTAGLCAALLGSGCVSELVGAPATETGATSEATTLPTSSGTETDGDESSTGVTSEGPPAGCGDGVVDPGEQCDLGADGNGAEGSMCAASCLLNICGDGFMSGDEACDDGNPTPGDGCDERCQLEVCGDKVVAVGEACDDGNDINTDGCLADCALASCGDGIMHIGVEECDDGNDVDEDACVQCLVATCGDGVVWPLNEACDDGNAIDDDKCPNNCTSPECGDGIPQAPESCDEGALNSDDASCKSNCQFNLCGDGKVYKGVEACDDGNDVVSDGCIDCVAAVCGDGFVQAGVELCDDGNQEDADACNNLCQPRCGNGVKDAGEACDDGNMVGGDTCGATCEREAFMVFVTSQRWAGKLGGPADWDARCNSAAAGKLPGAGHYVAWLSTQKQGESPDGRFEQQQGARYILPNGVTVADSFFALGQSLKAPIAVNELGQSIPASTEDCAETGLVWTATTAGGKWAGNDDCAGWTTNASFGVTGRAGQATRTDSGWTGGCAPQCNVPARLYCFEQPAP